MFRSLETYPSFLFLPVVSSTLDNTGMAQLENVLSLPVILVIAMVLSFSEGLLLVDLSHHEIFTGIVIFQGEGENFLV